MFWIWAAICFVSFAIRTLYNYFHYIGNKTTAKKQVTVFIYVVMGVLWFSWFSMNFNDPVSASLPLWLRLLGLLSFITGVSLFVFTHAGMGRLKDDGSFVTSGIYSRIRNPMYLGFILWVIGFPVFLESILTLVSGVFWVAHFWIWKILEEKDLLRRFSGYREYKMRTWF